MFKVGDRIKYKSNLIDNIYIIDSIDKDNGNLSLYCIKSSFGSYVNCNFVVAKELIYLFELAFLTDLCTHEYKEYLGFTENYSYCVKCNEKK